MGLMHQQGRNLVTHRSRTQPDRRRPRRTKQNIRPHTSSPLRRSIQRSIADANQRQNHRHFNGDGKHAQQRADWPMAKICEDQFIQQALSLNANHVDTATQLVRRTIAPRIRIENAL